MSTRVRYRIRFSKTDALRWISHRDLVRLWERLLRRVQLELSMSEGFHPKPRMSFPSALALGTASVDEVVEFDLAQELAPQDLAQRLRDDNQPGLGILQVTQVPEGIRKARIKRATYQLPIPAQTEPQVQAAIDRLMNQSHIEVQRKNKTITLGVANEIQHLSLDTDGNLVFTLTTSTDVSLRPSDVVEALKIQEITDSGQFLTRTRVELEDEIELTPSVTEQNIG